MAAKTGAAARKRYSGHENDDAGRKERTMDLMQWLTETAGGEFLWTMLVSMVSMGAVRVGLSYFFVYQLDMKLTGVWLAMCLDWVVRAIAFVWRYCSGKWLHKKVIDL